MIFFLLILKIILLYREIVNQLNEEVECLKQKILKKHLNKLKKSSSSLSSTETERKRQHLIGNVYSPEGKKITFFY